MPINDRRHSNYLENESIEAVNELSLLTTLGEIYRPGGAVSRLAWVFRLFVYRELLQLYLDLAPSNSVNCTNCSFQQAALV